ncbi:MAG: polynucleotide adenylyltransferase PcnB [Moraxella sp.]|nr:polynucleotide adenylyltransferase PcnB [Moraxella sp.]
MAKHTAKQLGLVRAKLPHSIIEVVGTLIRAGFDAYIVGGGVRDSLLGLAPKDFDAVTNARPQEIKQIFGGRCRVIGRRFQLAHVYSGREMIEVATFRAPPKDDTHTTNEGMITRDNVWGTIQEDFARRDFSINALYYNPIAGEVKDFCGALDDIESKTLRLLGKAVVRIEEDPVRLLRALRFKAKLGFEFDKKLAKQFHKDNWTLLEQVSAHRLYDETQKMFSGGYLTPLLPLLFDYGAMNVLMAYPPAKPTKLMDQVAKTTDERVSGERGANPAYFYAVLLWEDYLFQLAKFKKKLPFYEAQQKAASRVIERQRQRTAIPKFAEEFISQIWFLQPKLVSPVVREVANLERHPRFRAAYDFLVARELADDSPLSEPTNSMGKWWTQYQLFDAKGKQKLMDMLSPNARRRSRKRADMSFEEDVTAELIQLHKLTLDSGASDNTPAPLFTTNKPTPRPRTQDVVIPQFAPVHYSEADFLALLAEEPFIPAKRRRREPSNPSVQTGKSSTIPADTVKGMGKHTDSPPTARHRKSSAQAKPAALNAAKSTKNTENITDVASPANANTARRPIRRRATKPTAPSQTQKTATEITAAMATKAAAAIEAATETAPTAQKPKRRRKKSNAKPKADE